ncbi:MAG: hypothetical protein AB1758_24765, partial [Candidatus Eremiobacterota bacterium]
MLTLVLLATAVATAQSSIPGTYRGELPGRTLTLVLAPNRNAQLTTEKPGARASVQKGTWRSQGELVTVKLTTLNGKPAVETLVFQLDENELIATRYNVKKYGEEGLILSRPGTVSKPQIDSLVVSPARDLEPGDVLQVVVAGTAGCTASFDILGVIEEVPLPEVRPGRYQGTLTVTPDMGTQEAALVARLRKGEQEALKEASRPITVELPRPAARPVLLPAPGTRSSNPRPDIGVSMAPLPANLRMWVDGNEVSLRISGNTAAYSPPFNLTPGQHTARAIGTGLDETWGFEVISSAPTFFPVEDASVGPRPDIGASFAEPVHVNTLRLFLDNVEVTGYARMSTAEIRYTPAADLSAGAHQARIQAVTERGAALDLAWRFTVSPAGAQLSVTRPTNGEQVSPNFAVSGTATPGALVEAVGQVTLPLIPGVLGVRSRELTYSTYAAPDGRFPIP